MISYALRVDVKSPDDLQTLSSWLSGVATVFFVVREDHGNNEHFHVYLESETRLSSLRQSFKRKFPDHVGNDGYSMKECDGEIEQYHNYMCKGESEHGFPDVCLRHGMAYTDEWVEERHAAYWVKNQELARASEARKKLADYGNVVEKLELEAKRKGYTGRDREELAKLYIRMYAGAKKPINVFHAKGVINTVAVLLDECNVDVLASEIAARF